MAYQSLEAMIRAKNQKNISEGTKKWGTTSKEYCVNVKCKGGHSHDHKVEAFGHEHAHSQAHTHYTTRGHDVLSTSITQPNVMEDIAYDIEEEFIYEGNKAILKKEKKTPAKKIEDKTPGKVKDSDKKPPFAKKDNKDSDKKDDDKVPFKKDGDDKSSPFGSKSSPPKKDEIEGNGSKDSGKGKPTPHKNDDTNGENQKNDPEDKVKVGGKTEVIIDPTLDTKLDIDKKDDKKNLIKKEKVSEENLGEMSRKDDLEDIADFHKRKADSAARKGKPDDHHDNQATRAQGLIRMRNRRMKVAEEKIDEVSKGKLLKYVEKATSDYGLASHRQGRDFKDEKSHNQAVKRYAGINRAARKLAGTTGVKATESIINKVRSIVNEGFAIPGTRSDWLKSMNGIHRLYSELSIARHGSSAEKIGQVIQSISDSWENHNKKYVMFSEENGYYENRWNNEIDYLFESEEIKSPIGYHIAYHGAENMSNGYKKGQVVGKAKNIKRARRIVDKKDNEYGAYVHRIHPVYEEIEQLDEYKVSRNIAGYVVLDRKGEIAQGPFGDKGEAENAKTRMVGPNVKRKHHSLVTHTLKKELT